MLGYTGILRLYLIYNPQLTVFAEQLLSPKSYLLSLYKDTVCEINFIPLVVLRGEVNETKASAMSSSGL